MFRLLKIFSTTGQKTIVALYLLLNSGPSAGQIARSVEFIPEFGRVFAHSKPVQNTKDGRPLMFQFAYDKQFTDSASRNRYGCHPHHGFLVNYTPFRVSVLGWGAGILYYLQPSWRIGPHTELGFRMTTGLFWASNPFDEVAHPDNRSYSLSVNPYLGLSLHAGLDLGKRFKTMASVKLSHLSNGAITKPNQGLNWVTASLGIGYRLDPKPAFSYPGHRWRLKKKWEYSVAYFHARAMYAEVIRKRMMIQGIEGKAAYAGGIHGWSVAAEVLDDRFYEERARVSGNVPHGSLLTGLSIGHEFVFPRFRFSQQLGHYVGYGPGNNYLSYFYHRWGLVYFPLRKMGIGFNLKVHIESANFVDFRLVYAINR